MATGVLISCRMDSGRLPGRPLARLLGRPVLSHLVEALRGLSAGSVPMPLILATTDRPIDDPIAAYAAAESLHVFRGAAGDAAGRLLAAARQFELDSFVRVAADAVIVDSRLVQDAVDAALADRLDFVSNVPPGAFPQGPSVEVIRTDFLAEHRGRFDADDDDDDDDVEKVTSFFYRYPDVGRRRVIGGWHGPGPAGLSLGLDTPADARVLELCLRHLEDAPPGAVLETLDALLEPYRPVRPWVGSHGPLLIAEIGGNHEGDFGRAKALTGQAIQTRPDFIKFQIYTGDSLVSRVAAPDRHRHFQTFELTRAQHLELADMCQAAGVGYMASVWDVDAFDWIDPYVEIYKVGSGDLDATGMLRTVAARRKPIILSTGLSTEQDVMEAVGTLTAADARYGTPEWLALLQCTSMYPIERRDARLGVMRRLHELTGLPSGYSDHTEGSLALEVAAAMGARILEFHFTDRREGRSFRDHRVSLLPDEVVRLQQHCDEVVRLVGGARKAPLDVERTNGHLESFRRALYPVRDLPRGHRLRSADLVALRPVDGIAACEIDRVVGRRLVNDLAALAPIHWADVSEE